jgi:nucleotide-binding universal stress UspA family protein
MFDPLLVPLDGSQLSECVLPHALAIAQSFNAEMILFRMLEKNRESASAQLFDLLNWQINKTGAMLYLEKTKARFRESNIRVQTTVLEGLVAEGITEYAQNQGLKLIVLSSHGQNGLTPWGLSSVTQKIVLSAPTSVLIVRAHPPSAATSSLATAPFYQRILVPLDGSQRAENVLPLITQLARFHASQIHLVQVVQTPEMARQMPLAEQDLDLSNRLMARNRKEAEAYLEEVKRRSYLEGLTVQTHLLLSPNTEVALHQLAEQEKIDLVTLSAHGYSGNHQWPYGSLVNHFILYGKGHLLIVQDQLAKPEALAYAVASRERIERSI